jgi:hypothetical protein
MRGCAKPDPGSPKKCCCAPERARDARRRPPFRLTPASCLDTKIPEMVSCQESLDAGQAGVADRAAAAGNAGDGGQWGRRRAHRPGCGGALGEEGRDRRMAVEISGVNLRPSDDLITAAFLDYPRTGPVDGHAFEANGWVVSKAPVAKVEFVHEQSAVARCELTVSRPDVAAKYGSSSQGGVPEGDRNGRPRTDLHRWGDCSRWSRAARRQHWPPN